MSERQDPTWELPRASVVGSAATDDPQPEPSQVDSVRSTSDAAIPTLDYASQREMNVGRFVGVYLQVLAIGGVVSMVVSLLMDRAVFDPSPLLLWWAGSALKRRSEAARRWCLLIGRISFYGGAAMMLWGTVVGFSRVTVQLGSVSINDPPRWMIPLIAIPMLAIVGVPLFLLESKRAQRQFERPKNPYNEPAAVAERLRNVR